MRRQAVTSPCGIGAEAGQRGRRLLHQGALGRARGAGHVAETLDGVHRSDVTAGAAPGDLAGEGGVAVAATAGAAAGAVVVVVGAAVVVVTAAVMSKVVLV